MERMRTDVSRSTRYEVGGTGLPRRLDLAGIFDISIFTGRDFLSFLFAPAKAGQIAKKKQKRPPKSISSMISG